MNLNSNILGRTAPIQSILVKRDLLLFTFDPIYIQITMVKRYWDFAISGIF
jgi:hypothetical protein